MYLLKKTITKLTKVLFKQVCVGFLLSTSVFTGAFASGYAPDSAMPHQIKYTSLSSFFKNLHCTYTENTLLVYQTSSQQFLTQPEVQDLYPSLAKNTDTPFCLEQIDPQRLSHILGFDLTEENTLIFFDVPTELLQFVGASSPKFTQRHQQKLNAFNAFQGAKLHLITSPEGRTFFN